MSVQIEPKLVERAIRRGLSFTPELSEKDLPHWVRDSVDRISSTDTELLLSILDEYAPFVIEEVKQELYQCCIVIVPTQVFAGVVDVHEGKKFIFLFEGLLNLIACQHELSYFLLDFPKTLLRIFPNPAFPNISVQHWASILSGRLIHGYATSNEPLPDFSKLVGETRTKNIRSGFVSAIWWILLHELGHFVKKHVEDDITPIFPTCETDLLVADKLSPYQQAELEADAFVLESLVPSARKLYLAWMSGAIHPQVMFDSMLTVRKDTHPLSVDRLEAARRLMIKESYIGDDLMPEYLGSVANSYINTEQYQNQLRQESPQPFSIAGSKRENIEAIVRKIATYFEPFDLDFTTVLENANHSWRRFE